KMGVIDATDFVIRDAATEFLQGVAIPADTLGGDRMIDVVGDIEQVVTLLRRPFETLRRHQAGDPDRRMRFLVDRRQQRQAGERRGGIYFLFSWWGGPGPACHLDT